MEGLEGRELLSYGGSADFSFGVRGVQSFQAPAHSQFVATTSATQADGKLVVGGALVSFSAGVPQTTVSFAAARYDAVGTLDPSFGVGGIFSSPLLASTTAPEGYIREAIQGITLQPDGSMVLVGDIDNVAKVATIDVSGVLDPTFGTGGIVTLGTFVADVRAPLPPDASVVEAASSVATLPGGRIAVGGGIRTTSGDALAVELLNRDGSISSGFGVGGLSVLPQPGHNFYLFGASGQVITGGIVAQPDGKLDFLANVGNLPGTPVLTRLDASGVLDPTFGRAGQVGIPATLPVSFGLFLTGDALAIQPDGKLIVGGSSDYTRTGFNAQQRMVALRFEPNGAVDPSFGIGGACILTSAPASSDVSAIAIQADGKILLADRNNVAMARLNGNGLPDISFGEAGAALIPTASPQLYIGLVGISAGADGKITAPGQYGLTDPNGTQSGLYRVLGRGAAGDYDNDGISDPAAFDTATATLTVLPSGGGPASSIAIGDPGARLTLPAPGAYDGGGISEVAVYRPASGVFEVRPYNGGPAVFTPFGTPGLGKSYPAPGDYDGSGRTEYAVYLPSLGSFAYRPAKGGPDVFVPFGTPGTGKSIPAPADYFGTARSDVAVYLTDLGAYAIRNPVTGQDSIIPFGTPGAGKSIPVPGDYDGSGRAELAVYVPAAGAVFYRPARGGPDKIILILQFDGSAQVFAIQR